MAPRTRSRSRAARTLGLRWATHRPSRWLQLSVLAPAVGAQRPPQQRTNHSRLSGGRVGRWTGCAYSVTCSSSEGGLQASVPSGLQASVPSAVNPGHRCPCRPDTFAAPPSRCAVPARVANAPGGLRTAAESAAFYDSPPLTGASAARPRKMQFERHHSGPAGGASSRCHGPRWAVDADMICWILQNFLLRGVTLCEFYPN